MIETLCPKCKSKYVKLWDWHRDRLSEYECRDCGEWFEDV